MSRLLENQGLHMAGNQMRPTNIVNGGPLKPHDLKKESADQRGRVALGELSQNTQYNGNMATGAENRNLMMKTNSLGAHKYPVLPLSRDDNTMSDSTSGPSSHINEIPEITRLLAGYQHQMLDSTTSMDPQMCSIYSLSILEHLRAREKVKQPNHQYMLRQNDINSKMREILIDWLVEVHSKFKLRQETLYLTVNIIDRFLDCRAVARSKLQLVGCTAMLIASKYEEIYAPEVQDFVFVSDKAYTRDHILAMEGIMLNVQEFNITTPYAIHFAEHYLRLTRCNEEFTSMVNFLIELTLQDYKFQQFLPSMTACSAISLALHLSGSPAWSAPLQEATGYSEAAIRQCVLSIWEIAAKDNPKYRAVRKKYTSSKFHSVAKTTINPPPQMNQ